MIDELLSAPVEKVNPKYKCASPMLLWDLEEVIRVESSPRYTEMKEAHEKRRQGALKSVDAKKRKTKEQIDFAIEQINIQEIEIGLLQKLTLEYHQAFHPDEDTLKRWMVNFVRHNLSSYDEDIYELKGRVGRHEEYLRYVEAVLDKIAEVYPDLQSEVDKQKEKKKKDYGLYCMYSNR